MIQFNPDEVARLLVATRRYRDNETGSDYHWDLYQKLEEKLINYYEQVNVD